jgi:ankyrin repeat protein
MNEWEITKALREAVKAADIEQVRSLIGESRERLQQMTPFGTWLHVAAKGGNLELVKCLISMGADVNARGGTFGGTPINLAAGYGQIHIVEALLAAGAALDVSEPERNPLFSAIQGGHLGIVKLLVGHGIDCRVRYIGESMKDMDALAFARERGQTEIVNYLAKLEAC